MTHTNAPLKTEQPTFRAEVFVRHVGLSLIDQLPRELLYVSVQGVTVAIETSVAQTTTEFATYHFQIDNQAATYFPVVFAPTPVPLAKKLPCLQFNFSQRHTSSKLVKFFPFMYV